MESKENFKMLPGKIVSKIPNTFLGDLIAGVDETGAFYIYIKDKDAWIRFFGLTYKGMLTFKGRDARHDPFAFMETKDGSWLLKQFGWPIDSIEILSPVQANIVKRLQKKAEREETIK